MRNKTKDIFISDVSEIYLVSILSLLMLGVVIINHLCIGPQTSLYIFFKDIEFMFLVGILVYLTSSWEAAGTKENRGLEGDKQWEKTKKEIVRTHILDKDEEIKRVIEYASFGLFGLFSGPRLIRFDVLTDQRILRYKKYFGITEEIWFSDVKSYNYKISLMLMTIRFETGDGIKQFKIVMAKSLQKEMAPILENLMQEKGVPKNDNLTRKQCHDLLTSYEPNRQ